MEFLIFLNVITAVMMIFCFYLLIQTLAFPRKNPSVNFVAKENARKDFKNGTRDNANICNIPQYIEDYEKAYRKERVKKDKMLKR